MTLKQIEAFFWAARLHSFARAAAKLCMTQSALSKRIADMEAELGCSLFDRAAYRPALTETGAGLIEMAEHMLELRQQMVARASGGTQPAGQVAFGVTEMVAGTWLSSWVADMRDSFPEVVLQPHVDLSTVLAQRLRSGEIDLAVMPMTLPGPEFNSIRLTDVSFSMMALPEAVPSGVLTAETLAQMPVLAQSGGSGLTEVFDAWALANGVAMRRVLASNSLVAISELVLAGLGIALLPVDYYRPHLEAGRLVKVTGPLPWPKLPYYLVTPSGACTRAAGALRDVAIRRCSAQAAWPA